MNISKGGTAESYCCCHIAEAALHQYHIRSINGYICAGADSDTHISSCKGRGIVDTIAHHSYLAVLLKFADNAFLAIRKDTGNDIVHTGLSADGSGCPLIISGQHNHTDTHILKFTDSLSAVLLHGICNGNDACQFAIFCEKHRCLALFSQCFRLLQKRLGHFCLCFNKCIITACQSDAISDSCQTIARKGFKFRNFFYIHLLFISVLQNCFRQRMFTALLKAGCQSKQCFFCHALSRHHICNHRFSISNRTCLIQGNNLNLACFFQ